MKLRLFLVAVLVCALFTGCPSTSKLATVVCGNQLCDQNGDVIVLRGLNRASLEWRCVNKDYPGFISDDPPGTDGRSEAYIDTVVSSLLAWHVNAVRLPVNESCWNGTAPGPYSGAPYRRFVSILIVKLAKQRVRVVVDDHWSSSDNTASVQDIMPNRLHSLIFWHSFAAATKGAPSVVLDIAQEPWPQCNSIPNPDHRWDCSHYNDADKVHGENWARWNYYVHGGVYGNGIDYAGIADVIAAVRSEGNRNVIAVSGLGSGNSLFEDWPKWIHPLDDQLAATIHTYDFSGANVATKTDTLDPPGYLNADVDPSAAVAPFILGEFGSDSCTGEDEDDFTLKTTRWLDVHGYSGFAWAYAAEQECNGLNASNTTGAVRPGAGDVVHTWLASHDGGN